MTKQQMSDSDITKLIKEVKKRGCIWNPDDDNYSERYHLTVAWSEVSKILDVSEDVIRVKWKNLRDFFKKEVKKNEITDLDDYRGRWRHFKTLGFLLRPEAEDCAEEERVEEMYLDDEPEIEYEAKYAPGSNLEVFLEEEDPIPEKRRKTDCDNDDDYDMMFLKSLTPFLKQLEPTRNLVVRSRMQDMLLNEIAAQTMSNKRQRERDNKS